MSLEVTNFFDTDTATFTFVVEDNQTKKAAIIDSVLNYDPASGKTSTSSADKVIEYIKGNNLQVEWILETHVHADHLTAAQYIKNQLGGKIGIGSRIKDVLNFWVPLFNISHDTPLDGSQFDVLFEDNQMFSIGNLKIKVLHTPGHTPACVTYAIDNTLFVGDTIFMPDIGTARTDFPGGDAGMLYDSIKRILSFGKEMRLFTCHDYPPQTSSRTTRTVSCLSTVAEQKKHNILINDSVSREDYIKARKSRDDGKPVPRLLLPSIQFNLRAGDFGKTESNGRNYIKIPINAF